jgi:N-acetyl-anhydromuramyl-L-alanine amidase AmpD
MIDLNKIPLIPALRYQRVNPGRFVQYIVLHSMESPEKGDTAESVANYFKNGAGGRPASAHYCVDSNSIIQCVQLKDVAYACPSLNRNGVHIEIAGQAKQTRSEWLDTYSAAALKNVALLCAKLLCPKFDIPIVFCGPETLKMGRENHQVKGITTHGAGSKAFQPGGHWDPGPSFPMSELLDWIKEYSGEKAPIEPTLWVVKQDEEPEKLEVAVTIAQGRATATVTELAGALGYKTAWDPLSKRITLRKT